MYALQSNNLRNTSLKHVLSNLRNKHVGFERYECVESFEHRYYCGQNQGEL